MMDLCGDRKVLYIHSINANTLAVALHYNFVRCYFTIEGNWIKGIQDLFVLCLTYGSTIMSKKNV